MSTLSAIALLESAHHFPGPYMFKVIGRQENGFVARTVAAMRDEVGPDTDIPYSLRQTTGGRHVSVTLEVTMQTPQQVLAVYRRMRRLTGLVMLL